MLRVHSTGGKQILVRTNFDKMTIEIDGKGIYISMNGSNIGYDAISAILDDNAPKHTQVHSSVSQNAKIRITASTVSKFILGVV